MKVYFNIKLNILNILKASQVKLIWWERKEFKIKTYG